MDKQENLNGVAIIGMAGRFPGAKNVDDFWQNLCDGVESIKRFTDEEVIACGVDPALVKHPDYVPAWGAIEDIPLFDANYFGIPGREAEAMDPQHRHFLELCATALDDSGYNPETYDGSIGLVSGVGISTYLLRHVLPHTDELQTLGEYLVFIGNDKDFMPTRVSYKLDMRGPSHSVSTACSTSLVATHLAVQQLLTYQSDIALAGGINIKLPQETGYLYRKGQLKSPDGRCRAFDKDARGTVFGNGGGVVVLKRLAEAVEDGDHIYAVIKGSAINNDGSSKAGYTAPSVKGQSECIAEAHEMAGFDPETITHIEAHGTGTELGDPVEIKALNRVFGEVEKKQYIAMTSVKTNVGHLDNAAGITGLIKMAMTVKNAKIPPSLHYKEANPEIDFANSAFYVNTELKDWKPENGIPRRACQSSFGAGGTNAHVVVEQAPELEPSDKGRPFHLLTLSAKTDTALATYRERLAEHLRSNGELNFADAVYTMNIGRRTFDKRAFAVVRDREDAIAALSEDTPNRFVYSVAGAGTPEQAEHVAKLIETLNGDPAESQLGDTLKELGQLWLQGADLDWEDFYESEFRHRVRMPTYPFESKRYWLPLPEVLNFSERVNLLKDQEKADTKLGKEPAVADWFYVPSWKRSVISQQPVEATEHCTILFADNDGLGKELAEELSAQGIQVVTIAKGDDYEEVDEHNYTIDHRDPQHYNGLLTDLRGKGKIADRVIYMWNLNEKGEESRDVVESSLFQLTWLAQGLAAQSYTHKILVLVVTNQLQDVAEGEPVSAEKATLLGPLRVMSQEMKNVTARAVDVILSDDREQRITLRDQLCREMTANGRGEVVALRGRYRWVQDFEKVRPTATSKPVIRENGVYLITGGLGGIGLALANHMATNHGARLILTSRTALPERSTWADRIASGDDKPLIDRIQAVVALEEKGAEVLVVAADVADEQAMAAAVAASESRFGGIHGVIHTAGVTDSGMLSRKTREEMENVLAAKVTGTKVLSNLFQHRNLDFTVLCSSLASFLGGFGQAAYVAANSFMDAHAYNQRLEGFPTFSLNWDAWKEVGMAATMELKGDLQKWHDARLAQFGISPEEGYQALLLALGDTQANLVVSTHDFHKRVADKNALLVDEVSDALEETLLAKNVYPRPEMSVAHRAPSTPVETAVADIWQKQLGISGIGVDDDFFELGGDSLKGINLVNRLEQLLGEVVHVDALFDTSTISQLSVYLAEHYPEAIDRLTGMKSAGVPAPKAAPASPTVTADMLASFDDMIPKLAARGLDPGPKNKPATFVLAPPRSGSTLLRVMLGGNKHLFAPPELLMLNYNTMEERDLTFSAEEKHWLDGLIVGIMSIKTTDANHASSYVTEAVNRGLSTKAFYAELQSWIGERLLVDKTPAYAYDRAVLDRAEEDFRDARFIHLMRHPYATIKSYTDAKMDLLVRRLAGGKLPFTPREIAEMMYIICHRNILDFLETIPAERKCIVKFEDLVNNPQAESEKLCDLLGVPFDEDMLNPYKEKRQRMTEGVRHGSKMIGDIKFHNFQGIDPSVADAWKIGHPGDFLSNAGWDIAGRLGYGNPSASASTEEELDVDNMSEAEIEAMLSQMQD